MRQTDLEQARDGWKNFSKGICKYLNCCRGKTNCIQLNSLEMKFAKKWRISKVKDREYLKNDLYSFCLDKYQFSSMIEFL